MLIRELFLERIHYHMGRAQMHIDAGHPSEFAEGSLRKAAKWSKRLNEHDKTPWIDPIVDTCIWLILTRLTNGTPDGNNRGLI